MSASVVCMFVFLSCFWNAINIAGYSMQSRVGHTRMHSCVHIGVLSIYTRSTRDVAYSELLYRPMTRARLTATVM